MLDRHSLSSCIGVVAVPAMLTTLLVSVGEPLVYILLAIGMYTSVLILAGPRLSPRMWSAIGQNNLLAFGVMLGKIAAIVGAGAWLLNGDEQWQANTAMVAVTVNLIMCQGEYRDTIITSDRREPEAG